MISSLGMLLALNPFGDIVGITAFSGSLYAACFFPTLVVGLYWARGTAAGAVVCVLLGSTTVTAWYFAKLAGLDDLPRSVRGIGGDPRGLCSGFRPDLQTKSARTRHFFGNRPGAT